jgi:Holliday junction resolvase RusA-like endonuclease
MMDAAVSMADAPFHCPPDIVLDLPRPISVNRIWRATRAGAGRVTLSPEYKRWKEHADQITMAMGQFRGLKQVKGKFEALIVVERCQGDLDNRAKGVLDWLQSRGVIADDKFCERLVLEWGNATTAPHGCRVTVKPCQ